MLGHEHTVGQDGTHDEHAEERGTELRRAQRAYPQILTRDPQRNLHLQTATDGTTRTHGENSTHKATESHGGAAGSHRSSIHKSRVGPKKASEEASQKAMRRDSQAAIAITADRLAWCCHWQAGAGFFCTTPSLQRSLISVPSSALAVRACPFP